MTKYAVPLVTVLALVLTAGCDLNTPGPTNHESDIVGGDSIWYAADNPHVVTKTIHIRENGRLIVKPGCLVKFAPGAAIIVGYGSPGELQAVGTPDSIITFTSNAATPNPGDWHGFDFYEMTRTSTRLSYCEIDYACWPDYAAVNIEWDGSIGIDHTTIRNSSKYGIWFHVDGGYVSGFTGNTITACGDYPITIGPKNIAMLQGGNTLTGNGTPAGSKDGIEVATGDVEATGTWRNQGIPYILKGSTSIHADQGAYLTIESGTTVKMGTGCHIAIANNSQPGGLIADSVVFTSAALSPQAGDWDGIWFYSNSTDAQCRLTRCRIEYGGGDGYGNIWIEDALPTITGCYIGHSASYGIYLEGTVYPAPADLLANNTFESNPSGDVRVP